MVLVLTIAMALALARVLQYKERIMRVQGTAGGHLMSRAVEGGHHLVGGHLVAAVVKILR